MSVAITINGIQTGSVRALLAPADSRFDGGDIVKALSAALTDEARASLAAAVIAREGTAGSTYVGVECLADAGLDASFDQSSLVLGVTIPPLLLRPGVVKLTTANRPEGTDQPAFFSAYANFDLRTEPQYSWYTGGNQLDFPVELSAEPVFNIDGWVLEGKTTGTFADESSVSLDYARLVRDFPVSGTRLVAGTVQLPVVGLMNGLPLVAVGVFSEASMDPSLFLGKGANEELELDNPAMVSVKVNGVIVRRLRLAPGRYSLEDFSYTTGLNDVQILVEEDGQPPRTIRRSVAFDSRLLAAGRNSFSAGMGTFRWDTENMLLQGFFLHGFTPTLTAGPYLQFALSRILAGTEAITALPVGSLRLDAAATVDRFTTSGFGAQLEYRFNLAGNRSLPYVGAAVGYTSAAFLRPGETSDTATYAWQYSLTVNQSLPWGIGLGLGATYREGWNTADLTSLAVTLTKNIATCCNLVFNLNTDFPAIGSADVSASVSVSITPRDSRVTTSYFNSMDSGSSTVNFQVAPKKQVDDFGYTAGLTLPDGTSGTTTAQLGSTYTGQYLRGSLANYLSSNQADGSLADRLSFQAGSALVFADGTFGLSRPVSDSFVMIVPRKALRNERIVVNAESTGPQAVADHGWSAVLPGAVSYQQNSVMLDAPDAPDGTEVGVQRHVVVPRYRSGTVIGAGTDATVYVSGTLLGSDGKPVSCRTGTLTPADAAADADIEFFTDENGIFEAYGLKAGHYGLHLTGDSAVGGTVAIPDETSGNYALGDISLSASGKE